MCGIAGIYAYHYAATPVDRDELRLIREAMVSRGPDGSGEWFSDDGRVALGHRRLSIIDLSERGVQPMRSADGMLVVSFNGEIYNYRELRKRLESAGRVFVSASDTEVLLHLYAEKGERMVEDLRGMFAFALWDARKNALFLARDPFGIKPLYYADDGWTVRVASQVKALLAGRRVSSLREPAALAGFYLTGSVPEPFTLHQEIRQLPAGCVMHINSLGLSEPRTYRTPASILASAASDESSVRAALEDSVRHHLVADVPAGVFLSAGIDSQTIFALASRLQPHVDAVTLAFEEYRGSSGEELPIAAAAALRIGARHHVKILSRSEVQVSLSSFFAAMDQPSIDGINVYFVSAAAREAGLKVMLSGLGADELFGGYASFTDVPRWARLFFPARIPFLGKACRVLARPVAALAGVSPKAAALAEYGGSYEGSYFVRRGLFMPWELPALIGGEAAHEGLRRLNLMDNLRGSMQPYPGTPHGLVAALEASAYMRNQLLRDADWAGMAHSVEIRVPFVDVPLWNALARSISMGRDKRSLRTAVTGLVSDDVLRRQKTGFTVPVHDWLETQLGMDAWKRVPVLRSPRTHWSRRWSYVVAERMAA